MTRLLVLLVLALAACAAPRAESQHSDRPPVPEGVAVVWSGDRFVLAPPQHPLEHIDTCPSCAAKLVGLSDRVSVARVQDLEQRLGPLAQRVVALQASVAQIHSEGGKR